MRHFFGVLGLLPQNPLAVVLLIAALTLISVFLVSLVHGNGQGFVLARAYLAEVRVLR